MTVASVAPDWGTTGLVEPTGNPPEIALETIPCPNCRGEEFQFLLDAADTSTGLGGRFSLVRCRDCDLVLTNPRPTADALGWFYPQSYSPYQHSASRFRFWQRLEHLALRRQLGYPPRPLGLLERWLATAALWKFRNRLRRHQWIPFRGPGRLLDVGCGAGTFLERMRSFGWTVTGIEYAAAVARQVEQRTGIRVHVGTLPHPALDDGSFDAVTMWHVLEHVPRPRQLIESAAQLLRPGGLLVIEVPNIDSATFAEFGEHWFALELPRHLQHFSPQTLRATVPAELFQIVEIQQAGNRGVIKKSVARAAAAGRTEYQPWLARQILLG